jgi:hypothetical protein
VLAGQRQSDAPVSAYRRLLADVEFSLPDAAPVALARHSIRYIASATDQACRPRREFEKINPSSSARSMPDQAILGYALARLPRLFTPIFLWTKSMLRADALLHKFREQLSRA